MRVKGKDAGDGKLKTWGSITSLKERDVQMLRDKVVFNIWEFKPAWDCCHTM